MKQTKQTRLFHVLAVAMLSLAVGCGGGDTPTEDEPLQLAETAPVEELGRECVGEMAWYCEDVELEVCEDVGCDIRVYEKEDYRMCSSESPRQCGELEAKEVCERVGGCEWIGT